MNRHAEIAPLNTSFVPSTHFPSPCGNGGDESGKRAGMSPPHRSSLPPLPPYSQLPKTRQQIGSQNFIPGASLPQSISQPLPVFPFGAFPPMSPAPFTRPTTSGASDSGLPPRTVHRRAYSDSASVLDSLMPQSAMGLIYPEPIEMPVGVMKSKELDNVSDGDDVEIISGDWENVRRATSGVKRRAGKESSTSVSLDFNLNGKSIYESTGNASGLEVQPGLFSVSDMATIVDCEKLKGLAVSNPKKVKRILANRKSAARSKERKDRYMNVLIERVDALQHEASRLSVNTMLLERSNSALEEENKQLNIRVQGMEDQAKLRDALINQLTGEVQRLKLAASEAMQNLSGYDGSSTKSMDADMFQQLNIDQEPQLHLGFQ